METSIAVAYLIDNVASNVIDDLYNCAKSLLTDDSSCGKEFIEQLKSLRTQLPKVKAVNHAINNKGLGLLEDDKHLVEWSWQFKDAMEAAEDVLDEMEYDKIEKQLLSENVSVSTDNNWFSLCKKKFGEFSIYKNIVSGIKRKFDVYSGNSTSVKKETTAERLMEVVEELDKVIRDMQPFLSMGLPSRDAKYQEHEKFLVAREDTELETDEVVGRENERKQIIDWLIKMEKKMRRENPSSNTKNYIHFYAIVGEGGMGKTTLARLVKNDPYVVEQFDLILWVCISPIFDVSRIIKGILQDINKDQYIPQTLNALQKALKDQLNAKRFFLVLDDLWDMDNTIQLGKLMAPLKHARKGSTILVTTRSNSVAETIANVLETNKEVLILKGLEDEDYRHLFNRHAFAGANPECHRDLKLIGDEIAKKLGGCPLAAKILGEQLNKDKCEGYWNSILNEQIKVDSDKQKDGFKANLRLSYENLGAGLQKCFRFCSIFPRDFIFEKDELVYMWIGSGSISMKNRCLDSLESIGQRYINSLERESFFKKFNGSTSSYVMHDLLHDMARSVSVEECLSIEDDLTNTKFPITIRHLYISAEATNTNLFHEISQLEKLHTLIIAFKGDDPQDNHVALLSVILSKLPRLRMLSLKASFSCELPDVIGSLEHLRHLSVQQTTNLSNLDWFPETVYKLYNLRILRFVCGSGGNYTGINVKGLTNLRNLRYLEIPSTIKDEIPYIGKLAHLHGSVNFQVRKDEGYYITELKNLTGICELRIFSLEEVGSFQEVKEVNLVKKNSLRSLKLIWKNDCNRDPGVDQRVADELCPPEKLRELKIKGYNGNAPCWVTNFSHKRYFLTSISLIQCRNWSGLLDLTHLPLLECLQIKDVGFVSAPKISESSSRSLPASPSSSTTSSSLNKLEIKYCTELKTLQSNGFKNINSLKTVLIGECPNLIVTDANANFLPTTLEKLSIGSCRNLELNLDASLVHLTSLKNLSLENCATMTTLPGAGVFRELRALISLEIKECTELESLEGLEAAPSLNSLTIFGCNKLIGASLNQHHNAASNTNPTLNLKSLNIDKESLLSIEPLRNLIAVEEIKIGDASGVSTFQALFVSMRNLPSLSKLYICNATQLNSFPNFLTSLQSLHICGCSAAPSQQFQNATMSSHMSVELLGVRCNTQSFMSDLEFDRKDLS